MRGWGHAARGSSARRPLIAALCAGAVVAVSGPSIAAQPVAGVDVISVALSPPHPAVGQAATLLVRVRDPTAAISGLTVDLDEPGGQLGTSACELGPPPKGSPFVAGTAVTIRVPLRFSVVGAHKVSFTVRAGSCRGTVRSFTGSVAVEVPPAKLPIAASSGAARCKGASLVVSNANVAAIQRATLCLVNANRSTHHLKPLAASPRLGRSAKSHSADMVRRRYFEHQGPGGPSFETRLLRVHYDGTVAGEDIGYESDSSNETAAQMVSLWMNSPPHRANILRRTFRIGGVGVVDDTPLNPDRPGSTFTIDFGH